MTVQPAALVTEYVNVCTPTGGVNAAPLVTATGPDHAPPATVPFNVTAVPAQIV